ncbi:hypothetical protein CC85DRAFT_304906 [Cutaneotrichosporon oleaginosum]|uniref:Uncharacterized protein n=1 Tax=Cutaneotrichosporon oleaginosum TaxID=879819 RepID=A0A0J0XEV9_9TREE|nr:uncharacterized protein CC85DRAFT_304906 [Cutaneotrichosporon oleaginosum]KLT39601.1 hypothetical protein CC85DRAFT_304906 [Cutaneotrichosporon oleaginosum]TXT15471.1 hypothetical protein COLE_01664 [Cutaneotrichosporon oleaginosum]
MTKLKVTIQVDDGPVRHMEETNLLGPNTVWSMHLRTFPTTTDPNFTALAKNWALNAIVRVRILLEALDWNVLQSRLNNDPTAYYHDPTLISTMSSVHAASLLLLEKVGGRMDELDDIFAAGETQVAAEKPSHSIPQMTQAVASTSNALSRPVLSNSEPLPQSQFSQLKFAHRNTPHRFRPIAPQIGPTRSSPTQKPSIPISQEVSAAPCPSPSTLELDADGETVEPESPEAGGVSECEVGVHPNPLTQIRELRKTLEKSLFREAVLQQQLEFARNANADITRDYVDATQRELALSKELKLAGRQKSQAELELRMVKTRLTRILHDNDILQELLSDGTDVIEELEKQHVSELESVAEGVSVQTVKKARLPWLEEDKNHFLNSVYELLGSPSIEVLQMHDRIKPRAQGEGQTQGPFSPSKDLERLNGRKVMDTFTFPPRSDRQVVCNEASLSTNCTRRMSFSTADKVDCSEPAYRDESPSPSPER